MSPGIGALKRPSAYCTARTGIAVESFGVYGVKQGGAKSLTVHMSCQRTSLCAHRGYKRSEIPVVRSHVDTEKSSDREPKVSNTGTRSIVCPDMLGTSSRQLSEPQLRPNRDKFYG